jgi:surface protein
MAAVEAYACFTSSDSTLTFYYDNERASRSGTTFDLNTGSGYPGWVNYNEDVTQVVFDSSFADARPTSTYYWFYRTIHLLEITGMEYLNTDSVTNMGWMFALCLSLTSLDVSHFNTANVTYMDAMFYGCRGLTSLDVSNFNTTNVTNMYGMFSGCNGLTSLDVSSFNTAKVFDMRFMFSGCSGLTTIYAGDGWSTAAVTQSSDMFADCTSLVGGMGTTFDESHTNMAYARIDGGPSNPGYLSEKGPEAYAVYTEDNETLTFYYDNQRSSRPGTTYGLNTGYEDVEWHDTHYSFTTWVVFDPSFADARPTTTYRWFYGMASLVSITGMEYLNTDSVTNMAYMFTLCCALPSVDLSHFNTANVKNMSYMFAECYALTSLDLSSFNTDNVTNMHYMFQNCSALTTIYASSGWNLPANNFSYAMFLGCRKLVGGQGTTYDKDHVDAEYARIDGGPGNPGYFTAVPVAYACYTSDNTTLTFYYDSNRVVHGLTYDLNEVSMSGDYAPDWYPIRASVTQVVFDPSFADAIFSTNYKWFDGMSNLVSITGMEYLNTRYSQVMSYMFNGCYRLTSLDLSHLDTQRVVDMSYMFNNCSGLTNLDLSAFSTGKLKYMGYMFKGCRGLTSLDLSTLNTSKVTDLSYMLYGCTGLTSLDLSDLDTHSVTDMSYMFYGCTGLTNLDLSDLDTHSVTKMSYMFNGCTGLTTLDLSSFNTTKVTTMRNMFYNCTELTTIYAGDQWSTSFVLGSNSTDMFRNCTKLVGGQGTTYDASHTDKTYAHIDGGPSNPGYLSEKPTIVAYAVYTSDNTTLTFYFDNQRSTRTGTTYDLNTGSNDPGWLSDGNNTSVTQVVFDSSFADARPTSTYSWFCDMSQLQSFTGMEYLNTEDVTSMTYMFKNCTSLTVIDLSNFNTAKVTNMGAMFYGCTNLTTIYAGDGWTTASVSNTYSTAMFFNCICLVGGQGTTYNILHSNKAYAHIDGGPDNPGYFTEKPSVEAYAVYTEDNSTLTFYYDDQRSSRPGTTIYGLNTGTEEMEWHDNPYYFTRVVFDPSFADARPTTTYRWFYGMSNLVSITGMEYLNTDSVTNMADMFDNCRQLPIVDLSHFNTANVTTMSYMFANCRALTSLDLSSFNTDNVTTMESMFLFCNGLKSVDLSSFTNAKVRRTANMFQNCSALTTIYASSSWYLPANNFSYAMFLDCTSLVGGMGTTYDANHIDAEYAHIDGGPSNPGYFTEKVDVQPGDANGDTEVNITDVVQMINAVSSSNFSGIDTDAADVNGDTQVNITDVILLINYVSNGHW